MTTTATLAARLLAAIEETERLARDAVQETTGRWTSREVEWGVGTVVEDDCGALLLHVTYHGRNVQYPHIAHNDPDTVLRRCAADRRILDRHKPHVIETSRSNPQPVICDYCSHVPDAVDWPCPDVEDIVVAYRGESIRRAKG